MTNWNDPKYLREKQYKDSGNLSARNDLHVRFSENKYGWRQWLFDQLLACALPSGARILELGGGPGWLWFDNLTRIPADWAITLTDFSQGMVNEAQSRLAEYANRIRFEQVDIQQIPYPDASFDLVMAHHMLYHVPDRPKAYAEIRRVLKPGGAFMAATNGDAHMRELDDLVKVVAPSVDLHMWFNVRAFSLENGADQLAPYFASVRMERYPDRLRITDAESIVAYILSGKFSELVGDGDGEWIIAELRRYLENRIAKEGEIIIRKDSGLFIAQR